MKKVTKIEPLKKKDEHKKLRVAAYARVSTSFEEQLESLETQTKHYHQMIDAHDEWESQGVYVDEGLSGTDIDNRSGLLQLLEDCHQGKIDLVLTKSISRFSRNITECLSLVRELTSLGIAIHFDKENLKTEQMDGELLLSILASLAESESICISENQKWSLKKRVENHTYNHVSAPYGYEIKDGKLVINPEEAKYVREIFKWYLSGEGSYRIAKKLSSLGVKAPKSDKWKDNGVRYILTNEAYVGDFIYQKTYTDSQFKRHVNDGDVDKLYAPDNHEPIVSREVFEKVQDLLKSRSYSMNGKANAIYPLTQKIRCGYCGDVYKRRIHYSTNKTSYIAWCCSTHLKDVKSCPMKSIKEINLQQSFMTIINKLIFGRREIVEETIRMLSEPSFVTANKLSYIEEQLKRCQASLQTLSEFLANQLIDASFYQLQVNRLESEKREWLKEKEKLLKEALDRANELEELKRMNRFLKDAEYYDVYDEDVLSQFLEYVEVENRGHFHFHLKGGLVLIERSETK